jgi:ArsR family transcriptional regulator, arsenate/arsenite/antimonite-responsive transcriptional repressor / arsenate reductase (thioredoxin)
MILSHQPLSDMLARMRTDDLDLRAARHRAMGDPVRLAILDELAGSDRAPVELQHLVGIPSNLLAHHLDVLEAVGLIGRTRSSGDGRRRYVHLHGDTAAGLEPRSHAAPSAALFVCTRNSARSQLAAAIWRDVTHLPAASAGTHPAERVHPGAVAAARRVGLDLSGARPRQLSSLTELPPLVVTVCDRAHEELPADVTRLHWSIADPVAAGRAAAFDATVAELRHRVGAITARGAA